MGWAVSTGLSGRHRSHKGLIIPDNPAHDVLRLQFLLSLWAVFCRSLDDRLYSPGDLNLLAQSGMEPGTLTFSMAIVVLHRSHQTTVSLLPA